ncbi:hypothetical protein HHI36_016907 [Cryptolaemus montrouzieri]|uniref:Ubiquitin activating enzyme 4 n=1 Tax=Cryptolaemus montrouzieri TaxID=559131 RepID=A0ABD2NL44_9CUCU
MQYFYILEFLYRKERMTSKDEISELKDEILELKTLLKQKEKRLKELINSSENCPYSTQLSCQEISRYSRHMLIPQIGMKGQIAMKQSSVLIIGLGGLGCPAALYLAAAGIGTITFVDYDEVEITNFNRQILHAEDNINVSKVESACDMLQANSNTLQNLFDKNKYDVVLDGSDNVATRYLLNDMCVLNQVPLVSGSALQMEGQLTVYNFEDGPCYRCLFPIPPPPDTVTNCGDGGVLGAVTGVIGALQALETIKILTKADNVMSGRLLIFDASSTTFLNVKLRKKQETCDVCGLKPKITQLIDYEQFCGSKAHDKVIDINILTEVENICVKELATLEKESVIIDVRPKIEYEICKLPNTINIPYTYFKDNKNSEDITKTLLSFRSKTSRVFFICRRGNDSQRTEASMLILSLLILHFPFTEKKTPEIEQDRDCL